ncbi:MAG TPA: EAL domain-containing protein [Terracidiphilus sp.]|nr:EAL domain-containing protein [Terracidiphilus sp.]
MTKRSSESVLLVENRAGDAEVIREMFRHQGSYVFKLTHADGVEEAERYLAKHPVDVVLVSLELPDAPGLEAVRRITKQAPSVAIVALCGPESEPTAMEAMRSGAQDYLLKGRMEPLEMMRSLRSAVERKILEDVLFNEQNRAQVTLDSIGDGVICTDVHGNISYLNPAAESMTGSSLKEALGQPMADVFHLTDADSGKPAQNPMVKAIGQNRLAHLPINCRLTRPDGREMYIEDSAAPIHDHAGIASGSVLVFRDVTKARELTAELAHLAEHDALTGLPNRLLFRDRLDQAIARAHRNSGRVVVVFVDLDRFKQINDSLGHSVGDSLLKSVAKRLIECVRAPDTVSRQGGDEFVLLLQDVEEPEDVAAAAIRILKCLENAYVIGAKRLFVNASMGVSMYPEDGLDAETLISNADIAMYQSKEMGRRTFQFFKPEMNARAVERQSIEEDLRRALERQEFELHYQPKFNLKSGAITGAEALLRWNHPTLGLIAPLQFIPIAEDSGMIQPIGSWVLREACRQSRAWTDAGLQNVAIAVNVSALQFRSNTFLEDITAILAESNLDSHLLELELTESMLMDWADLEPTLRSLRSAGVRISVDDFGTGYSSLSYIRKLPLDSIKIDQSFVRQISAPPRDTAIVSAIVSMASSLNLQVIAEGVETAEELKFLASEGCDEAQGYYFSRPVPAKQFAKLLGKRERLNFAHRVGFARSDGLLSAN